MAEQPTASADAGYFGQGNVAEDGDGVDLVITAGRIDPAAAGSETGSYPADCFGCDAERPAARHAGDFVAPRPRIVVMASGMFPQCRRAARRGYGPMVRDRAPGRRDGLDWSARYHVFEVGDCAS